MSMSIEKELVAKYGSNILTVRRDDVPPRRAKPEHLDKHGKLVRYQMAVIPKPGARAKLVTEIKRAGFKAHLARHRVTKEVTANLVFTNALPAFNKHARDVLADIPSRDILRLYGERPPPPPAEKPFQVGEKVSICDGLFAGMAGTLDERKSKASWLVNINGKRVAQHITNMLRIDPG